MVCNCLLSEMGREHSTDLRMGNTNLDDISRELINGPSLNWTSLAYENPFAAQKRHGMIGNYRDKWSKSERILNIHDTPVRE